MSKKEEANSFKVIVAIKCAKEHSHTRPPTVRCTISIQDKQKSSTLPFSEGQFFDLRELDVNRPIALTFHLEKSNKEIGTSFISIPESILTKEELEIADDFVFNYSDKDFDGVFRGSYYIIILNKKAFLQKDDSAKKQVQFTKDESPKPQQLKVQASQSAKSPGVKKGATQVQKPTREEELKRQNSAKKLQERVESSVKNAEKEMQKVKDPQQESRQLSKGLSRGATLIADLDGQSPTRISNQVQLTRSGTQGGRGDLNESQDLNRSGASPQRLQTFNIDDSPSKLNRSTTSVSPGKHHHHEGYNPHSHSTLACLYYIDQANMSDQLKTQADYFKKMIYSLQSKIDGLKSIERANDRLVAEVKRQEQQIKDLERLLHDAQDNFKGLRAEINSSMDQAFEERQELEAKLRAKSDQCNELERKNSQLEHKLEQALNQIVQMDRRVTELLAVSRQSKQNEQKLDEHDRTILENLRNYENKIRELQGVIQGLEKQRQEVQGDLNKANQNIVGLKGDLSESNHKNKELSHDIGSIERKLQVYKAQEATIKTLNDQVAQQQKDIIEAARQKQHVEGEVTDLRKDLTHTRNQLAAQEKNNNERMNALRQKIVEAENRISQIQNELDIAQKDNIKVLISTKQQHRQENKDLLRDIKLTKDLQSQIDSEKSKNGVLLKQVKESQVREKEIAESFKEANVQLFQARQEINELQQELLETQQYCAQLKKLILEMKETGAAYIPFHNDPIDKALSEFINSLNDPERIKDLFVRESEGVYTFGTKKIYAKIEQDRILIRAGGGFLGVEEFLDLYAAAELEKIEKQDPKRQYDQNKALSGKVDQGRVVREYKRQSSPVRNKSPH